MNVNLVEDDPAVRDSLKLRLIARGHSVSTFSSSEPALDAEFDQSTRLIADYLMPDIDGIALLRILRAKGWAGLAFLITGHFDATLEIRAKQAGYSAVFEKPLRFDRLIAAMVPLTV